ncbi:MAG: polyprenyl synthetase family protein [Candidatus Aminicenantes bacterium]|nr:MAG: polyprenyl synthetase family protein [Candidatus Aminicenantes bacterium]
MRVEDKIYQKKETVDRELERILPSEDTILFKAMRYAVLSGGKRFRPILVLSSGESFGVSQTILLPFACAIELIHNYSLIHDDLPSMDNDDFRRGRPSCHKAYGEAVALLVGDGLLTLAFKVLAQASLEEELLERKNQIILEVGKLAGIDGMIAGQFMDITLSPEEITEEEFEELIFKKTAALFIASVKVGAILGKASPPELNAIVEYGRNLGLAFQIRDDILDSASQSQKQQSPQLNYVTLFGLEKAERNLRNLVNKTQKTLDEASLESDELRYLASKLLDIGSESRDEQNSR